MTPQQIIDVVRMYKARLLAEGVPKKRINPGQSFGTCTTQEILAHAHYLCEGVESNFAARNNAYKHDKANRHLTAIQMCLSFANWYTLEQLMEHNRSLVDV